MPAIKASSIRTGLPAQPLTENAELFNELLRLYNAVKILVQSLDLHTGEAIALTAGEAIAYGKTVGIKSDGTVWMAKDGTYPAIGWCTTPGGVVAGESVTFQTFGLFPEFAAGTLTPGTRYYQSSTAGTIGVVGSAPSWGQVVGIALSDTQLYFMPNWKY